MMSNLGFGVMIGYLAGNQDSVECFSEAQGKTITELKIENDELRFTFSDASKIGLFDDGQSCCEHRYMVCDDNLDEFIGSKLLFAEVRDGPTGESSPHGQKDCQFLVVSTSYGQFTVANYNEHNGYYGGFLLRAREL